ncbi:MAG: hypothetical protein KJ621_05395 [Proteobacteria bacterium]|nr:hypothetical protein [Pseudomonadota bacterium]
MENVRAAIERGVFGAMIDQIEATGTQCIIKIGWVAFELPLALRRR